VSGHGQSGWTDVAAPAAKRGHSPGKPSLWVILVYSAAL
jgi:hypothetical protein